MDHAGFCEHGRVLPSLIASDLDGTLLRSDGSLSPRTSRALAAVQAAGCRIVLCTARPVRWVRPIAAQAGASGCAVCVNGAVIWDFAADRAVSEDAIDPEVVLAVVDRLGDLFPGGAWGVEHAAGFDHEPGYRPHWPVPPETVVAPVRQLLGVSALKLLFRHDAHSPDEMLAPARAALRGVVELSHSNSSDGLLEISAPGIDKGAALGRLCATLGVSPQDVIAFGDMPNDLALLRFAGRAVAVANAHPDVLAIADEVTSGQDEDGVAVVLERLLA
jgi:hydroxymethylpyrimidine pyrophosphatase-like HAD family hydrolase